MYSELSPEKFSHMLTEALYKIKGLESKSLQIIQDELGFALGRGGGTAVAYWRQGNIPAKRSDFEQLAAQLQERAQEDDGWVEAFTIAAGFPYQPSFEGISPSLHSTLTSSIPPALFHNLIGRTKIIDKIMTALQLKNGSWLIGIDGLGGIGKTAVAQHIANMSHQNNLFEYTVWASAHQTDEKAFTFETILDNICHQINLSELTKLSFEQKASRLKIILRETPTLIILDNLETAHEPQETIIKKLIPFLNPTKVMLTSRHRFRGDVFAIHLSGLSIEESIEFLQADAKQKGIEHIQKIPRKAVEQIMDVTGGSPLALKLIVSQIVFLPLNLILEDLKQGVALAHVDDGGEYVQFYRRIFSNSWSLIQDKSRMILVSMAHFSPTNGSNFEAIKTTSSLATTDVKEGIDELWKTSLLEIGSSSNFNEVRYFLHPLTQYFVLSDIVKVIE